jgi:hypothetical protein
VIWKRSGAAPELSLPPTLAYSTDESSYVQLGTMARVSDGWRVDGFVPPLQQNFYLRAQGTISTGRSNASGSLIESTLRTYLDGNEGIFYDKFE